MGDFDAKTVLKMERKRWLANFVKGMLFGCEQPFLQGERCVTSQKKAAEEVWIGKIYLKKCSDRYPHRPTVLPIKRTNHIDLRVCKNIKQSEPRPRVRSWPWRLSQGVCMKVRFKSKVTRGFSFSPLPDSCFHPFAALSCEEKSRKTSGTRLAQSSQRIDLQM